MLALVADHRPCMRVHTAAHVGECSFAEHELDTTDRLEPA
jgi:hypothetical protein